MVLTRAEISERFKRLYADLASGKRKPASRPATQEQKARYAAIKAKHDADRVTAQKLAPQ